MKPGDYVRAKEGVRRSVADDVGEVIAPAGRGRCLVRWRDAAVSYFEWDQDLVRCDETGGRI
jgi:hypothetical protein